MSECIHKRSLIRLSNYTNVHLIPLGMLVEIISLPAYLMQFLRLSPFFPLPSSFFVLLSPFSLSVSRSNLSHSHHQKGNQITLSLTWPVKICFTYRNGHFWPPCASVSFISLRCHIQYSWHVSNNIRFTCQGYYQRFSTTRHCIRRLHVK